MKNLQSKQGHRQAFQSLLSLPNRSTARAHGSSCTRHASARPPTHNHVCVEVALASPARSYYILVEPLTKAVRD